MVTFTSFFRTSLIVYQSEEQRRVIIMISDWYSSEAEAGATGATLSTISVGEKCKKLSK